MDERSLGLLGYSPGEVKQTFDSWRSRIHPDDEAWVMATPKEHLEGFTPSYSIEHRLRGKTGEWKWVLSRGRVLERDENGRPLRMSGTVLDIDDRKKTEEALRENEERLRQALEVGQLGSWGLNVKTGQAWRSLRHDQIFGYQELLPEWTYQMFLQHVLPEDSQAVDEKYSRALREHTEWSFECRIRRADGMVRWSWA